MCHSVPEIKKLDQIIELLLLFISGTGNVEGLVKT